MLIEFERTGGFAGLRMVSTVDTATLPPEEAQQVEALVRAAHFFELPHRIAAPSRGADRFNYRLTVEAGAQRHTVEVAEAAVPEALQPLLRRLTSLARQRR